MAYLGSSRLKVCDMGEALYMVGHAWSKRKAGPQYGSQLMELEGAQRLEIWSFYFCECVCSISALRRPPSHSNCCTCPLSQTYYLHNKPSQFQNACRNDDSWSTWTLRETLGIFGYSFLLESNRASWYNHARHQHHPRLLVTAAMRTDLFPTQQ